MGLDKISKEELDELYIYYEFDNHQNLELWQEYIVLLKENDFYLGDFTILNQLIRNSITRKFWYPN